MWAPSSDRCRARSGCAPQSRRSWRSLKKKELGLEHFFKKLAEEQIEEEETFQNLVSKVEIYDGTKSDMYAFDEHLGSLAAKREKSGGC